MNPNILLEAGADNYVLWLSLILCGIGCVVIFKGRKKK